MNQPAPRRPYAKTYDQRRRTILNTAWQFLAEGQEESFSVLKVSKQSGVALRTIYNAFGDREGLIAQTLVTHHADLFSGVDVRPDDCCLLSEAVDMCRRVAYETIKYPRVAITTSRAYFASRERPALVAALRDLPASIAEGWMRSKEANRELIDLFGESQITRQFANAQWALISDWVAAVIDDEQFVLEQCQTMIILGLSFGNNLGRKSAKNLASPAAS